MPAAGRDVGSTSGFGTSKALAFRTVTCGESVGSTTGPSWTVFGTSGAPTFRTIALGEIAGTLKLLLICERLCLQLRHDPLLSLVAKEQISEAASFEGV